MGVSGHFRRSASPAGKVNGHRLIVFCLHTGVAVAGMSRKENVILHVKHSVSHCRLSAQKDSRSHLLGTLYLMDQASGIEAQLQGKCHLPLHLFRHFP